MVIAIAIVDGASAQADTVFYVGGTTGTLGRVVPAGTFGDTADLLGGALGSDPVTVINYPASLWPVTGPADPTLGESIASGVNALETEVLASKGPLTVVGTSQGAMVVQQAAAQLNDNPAVPSDTTFVLTADPNLGALSSLQGVSVPGLDYTPEPLPDTRFHVVVVKNQYDGFADPPTDPSNRLAVLNAVLGIAYVHPFAQNTDLRTVPARDITTTRNALGGTTTIYRVPTRELPLTMPLRQAGIPAAEVDFLDAALRPIVDAGYQPTTVPSEHSTTAGTRLMRTPALGLRRPEATAPSITGALSTRQPAATAKVPAGTDHLRTALRRIATHVPGLSPRSSRTVRR